MFKGFSTTGIITYECTIDAGQSHIQLTSHLVKKADETFMD